MKHFCGLSKESWTVKNVASKASIKLDGAFMTSFSRVLFDASSKAKRNLFEEEFTKTEGRIVSRLDDSDLNKIYKKNAIEALQVAHMWVMKAIRDEQLARNE